MLETIKDHPYITAGAVVGGGILLYLLTSTSGSAGDTEMLPSGMVIAGPTAEQVAAGTQLQALQLEAADRASQRQTELQALEMNNATAITAAEIEASSKFNLAQMESDFLRYQMDQSVNRDLAVSTLEAQVAERQIDLEAFKTSEASRNTQTALAYEYDLASTGQVFDYQLGKKELKNENKANKRANKTAKKVVKAQVKLGKVSADVTKSGQTKDLIGGIIGSVFGVVNNVVGKKSSSNKVASNKKNTGKKKK